ncbi:hypothetical protein A2714_01710 [Candidatus Woesebacteria bacterium RIFCSPHIGHO2_01_FULL_38_9]|uniref:HAD family hydrolase n=2 Tax=Candidatus Woeseibacteriota TaxID=1752722 RepID=A0A1F7XZE7_9BACT|nr:MAG: hypothetical protein A2714_01710 [Candidatus Woesebacteria bacterium RIFCSPHIGHO2_01_FULL_38_9]OGM59362.1 MAG: hypothetical protein A3A75_03355 [Candidatus Woesebacteria bacterium RIFCSPLOWO2_01_FULL_39_10]
MILSAVIFDLDGTVLANEDEWGEAFGKVLKSLGVKGVESFPHIGGIGIEENWPMLIKKYNINTSKTPAELTVKTLNEYHKLIPRITLNKGFVQFASEVKASGILTALATSSTWNTVQKVFGHIEIENYFDSVTTGEEVSYKKPDPEIFLMASEKLGVDPGNCLVIEDSAAGIEAARKANMRVVAIVRDEKHAETLKKANLVVNNFPEITPDKIAAL